MTQPLSSRPLVAFLGLAGLVLLAKASPPPPQGGGLRSITAEQQEILDHMSLVDLPDGKGGTNKTLRITGLNVQIVNGLGATNGFPSNPNSVDESEVVSNGLGNLILGYDELAQFTGRKTGSHNLVIGPYNDYTSFGGAVIGRFNRVEAPVSAVVGGNSNYASGISSAVLGGVGNGALGDLSLAAGGLGGEARSPETTVMGGQYNRAIGLASSCLGGFRNVSGGALSSVTGGSYNIARGGFSSVSGGAARVAPGESDWAAGGLFQDF